MRRKINVDEIEGKELNDDIVTIRGGLRDGEVYEKLLEGFWENFERHVSGGDVPLDENATEAEIEERRFQKLEKEEFVLLPVTDMVIFPNSIIPVSVESPSAIAAVEYAMEHESLLLMITRKHGENDSFTKASFHKVGCVCAPVQAIRIPGGGFKLIVHGIVRASIKKFIKREPVARVSVGVVRDVISNPKELEVVSDIIYHQLTVAMENKLPMPFEFLLSMRETQKPWKMIDGILLFLNGNVKEKQAILDDANIVSRLHKVAALLSKDIEILKIEKRLRRKTEDELMRGQKEFYLHQHMKSIREELGESVGADEDVEKYKEAISASKMEGEVREHAEREVARLSRMSTASPDYDVVCNYLDRLLSIPWGKYTEDSTDIKSACKILNEEHYGLEEVKDRILEFLAVRYLKEDNHGSILCFVGPPGVGKTSLGKSIAKAMNRKFHRASLGGMHDEAEIRGHRRTYMGSMPGRIVQALCSVGTLNPVLMLDEIDKLGKDYRGDPAAALLETLDPEQNCAFKDNYFGVPIDLSSVFFIMTANTVDSIPPALRDRMEIIRIPGYTSQEKFEIAKRFLIDRQRENCGLNPKQFALEDDSVKCIIKEYTKEAGVRNLEREIGKLGRKIAREVVEGKIKKKRAALTVEDVHKILGVPRYLDTDKIEKDPLPGVVQGLSWTQAGGETLVIETNVIPGRGKITLTGNLGHVMKESARAAITWSRGYLAEKGVDFDF